MRLPELHARDRLSWKTTIHQPFQRASIAYLICSICILRHSMSWIWIGMLWHKHWPALDRNRSSNMDDFFVWAPQKSYFGSLLLMAQAFILSIGSSVCYLAVDPKVQTLIICLRRSHRCMVSPAGICIHVESKYICYVRTGHEWGGNTAYDSIQYKVIGCRHFCELILAGKAAPSDMR